MAKKPSSEESDPFTRRISTTIPGVNGRKQEADPTYNEVYGGWRSLSIYPLGLVYEDTISLSGYHMQDLTYYPELGFNQIGVGHSVLGNDGGEILDCTIVSLLPIKDDTSLWWWVISGSSPALPQFDNNAIGFDVQDTSQWETLPFMEQRLYARNTNVPGATGFMQPLDRAQLGSLDPFAVDKLYVYRVVLPYSNTGNYDAFSQVSAPPSRVGFIGTMAKEDDIEYLMRLKRGYELANQV
jgi:hypothetical protein